MMVFLCENSPEGIFSGVYDAWMSRLGHKNVSLAVQGEYNYTLFSQCREVEACSWKAEKVVKAVREKISELAYSWIYRCALSPEPGRADVIYRFLIYGFHIGSGVTGYLQIPEVHGAFAMNRAVADEAHLLMEFVRFEELAGGILFAPINPKNDVTALLMPHFCDRMPEERFIIYDEKRKRAGVHTGGREWYFVSGEETRPLSELAGKTDRGEYAVLWRAFFSSIAVPERKNPVCQRSHLPLHFRSRMTEFQQQADGKSGK